MQELGNLLGTCGSIYKGKAEQQNLAQRPIALVAVTGAEQIEVIFHDVVVLTILLCKLAEWEY